MLKIRLQRVGRRNNPSYRIVAVESSMAAKRGKPVELLGAHDTIRKKTTLKKERIQYWISKGARTSDTMRNILITNGVIQGVKKNNLPKKSPVKSRKEEKNQAQDTASAKESSAPPSPKPPSTEG